MKLTTYIEEKAKDLLKQHKWHFKDHLEVAYAETENRLQQMNLGNFYVEEWKKRVKTYYSVFDYYGLLTNSKLLNNIPLRQHIKGCSDLLECVHFAELHYSNSEIIINKLCSLNPSVSVEKIESIIIGMDDAIKILIQEFIKQVGKVKAYERMDEELNLLEEIEALKKMYQNERDNKSD